MLAAAHDVKRRQGPTVGWLRWFGWPSSVTLLCERDRGAGRGRPLAGDVMFTEFDRLAMTRALALAERGLETTHPNPRVGCVIAKGDRFIGEGFHERSGEPHAEVMALRSAKEPVAGATAYVTLEPCSHHGRTPPCASALIEARIARVVFAVQDPNPRVSGQGADALLRAGITVEAGLLEKEATELNIGFMKRMREGLPWVRVKLAMSLDGRTALANGASQWITGEAARADVQRWRARCSAVMTGVGTVLADDPQLNVRLPGFKGRQPLRVVLDARLRSPAGARLFAGLSGVGGAGAGSAERPAGAPGVGGAGIGVAGAGAAVSTAAGVGGTLAGSAVVGGPVVVFVAAGGGFSVASGAARAAVADSSALADDMAELVSAFETSPASVAARVGDLGGATSLKAEARPATAAPAATNVAEGATDSGSANSIAPPVLAAAGSAAGVAPGADDATWAGAALSGAIPVQGETGAVTDGTAPVVAGSPPATATLSPAPPTSTVSGALGSPAPGSAGTLAQGAATASAAAIVAPEAAKTGPAVATGQSASTLPLASAAQGALAGSYTATSSPDVASRPSAAMSSTPSVASSSVPAIPLRTEPPARAVSKPDSLAAFQKRQATLSAKGARIEEVPSDDGYLDLFAVLKKLGEMEVNEVLVEAGPTLAGQLLTTFLVDELLLYVAPKLLGPQGRPLVNLPELQSLQDAWGFSLFDAKRFGDDLRLRMRPK